MSTLELKVYDILKLKLGEAEAATVIEYFESKSEQKFADKKDFFLTKEDKVELVEKIESTKADIIKWMFIFWIGQVAVTFGLIVVYLKK